MDVFFVEQSAARREITQRSRFTRKSPVVAPATFSPRFYFYLNSGPLLIIFLGLIVKGSSHRAYLFILKLNARYFVFLVQFSLGRMVCLIPIEHENVALAKKKCFLATIDP